MAFIMLPSMPGDTRAVGSSGAKSGRLLGGSLPVKDAEPLPCRSSSNANERSSLAVAAGSLAGAAVIVRRRKAIVRTRLAAKPPGRSPDEEEASATSKEELSEGRRSGEGRRRTPAFEGEPKARYSLRPEGSEDGDDFEEEFDYEDDDEFAYEDEDEEGWLLEDDEAAEAELIHSHPWEQEEREEKRSKKRPAYKEESEEAEVIGSHPWDRLKVPDPLAAYRVRAEEPDSHESEGSVFDGMLEEEEDEPTLLSDELVGLYDDFEIGDPDPPVKKEPQVSVMHQSEPAALSRRKNARELKTMEERTYIVTAEGIAVRSLPDERSPRTGEILRQGEHFTAIEAVDGEGLDQRLYLRLPKGRGWVFDDEKLFPGLPSVKLVAINGARIKEEEEEPIRRPSIAIIGRPNTGKSTLVNRIADEMESVGNITYDEPGVTRDRIYKQAEHTTDGVTYLFDLVDTGGMVFYDDPDAVTFHHEMRFQIDLALRESVAAILVVDAWTGLTQDDLTIAKYLRERYIPLGIKVRVAVAKCDELESMDLQVVDFWSLKLGEPIPICAIKGRGVWEIVDSLIAPYRHLYPIKPSGDWLPPPERDGVINVAICGRPNAGKSSLLNAIVGEDRSIVSATGGTTTDCVDAYFETNKGKCYRFVDTAGISRRKKDKRSVGKDFLATHRALKAVQRADCTLYCIDASEVMQNYVGGTHCWVPTDQDRYLARQIEMRGSSCVVVLTKWDAVKNKTAMTMKNFTQAVRHNLLGIGQWAEVVTCSAMTGQRLPRVFKAVDKAVEAHARRFSTSIVNEVVRDALMWKLPQRKSSGKKAARIYYATQVGSCPPTFAFFCNDPSLMMMNYESFLQNKLRQDLNLFGTPMQLEFRRRTQRKAIREAHDILMPKRLAPSLEQVWR